MLGTLETDPANAVQKHAFWAAYSVSQALLLCPLFFYGPAILGRAGLYTVGMVGSLSYIAATAKTDKYLYLGGPLFAGLTILVLTSFAPMVLPAMATRTLVISESITIYGGLALFGGYVMYDVQRVMANARLGHKDPAAESISLELDFLNIFIRFVSIMAESRGK
jgi:growth hormone-inducible transmembrane protein